MEWYMWEGLATAASIITHSVTNQQTFLSQMGALYL